MYIRYEPNDFCGGKFFNEKGQQITLSPDSYLADTWEPYKEPCKHEPEPYTLGSYWQYKIGADRLWKHGGQTVPQELFKPTCKYCSKPIKPKDGWVGV